MNDNFILIHKYLILLIPVALLTGPFLPDLFVSISGLILLYLIYRDGKYYLFKNNYLFFFYFFYIYLIISSFLSTDKYLSFSASLFFFRFIILGISVYYIFLNDRKFIDKIYFILSLVLVFLILDSLYQYISGQNIFGLSPRSEDRITSVFGQDSILGSFLIRILPIYFACFFLSIKKYYYIFLFNIIFSPIILILSGERTAIILYILFLILTLIFINIKKIYKTIFVFSISLLVIITFSFSQKTIERVIYKTLSELKYFNIYKSDNMKEPKLFEDNEINYSKNTPSVRLSLYKNSLLIFKNNIFFGSGPKTFRKECKIYEQETVIITLHNEIEKHKIGCSTHPHNTYLQLLAETGLFGFSIILILYLFILVKILVLYFGSSSINTSHYNFNIFILFSFLINYFPFIPSGNYFNNWLDIMYFFPLGFLLINISND